MTQEEKAKAYDEAFNAAKEWYNNPNSSNIGKSYLYAVFPDLKESKDEKMWKLIKKYAHYNISDMALEADHITREQLESWLEKQGEQKPIINVPPREVILAIWDLGNEWKELTGGSISTKYGTQLDYIQKHWQESEYYLREKQGEQKSTDKVEPKFKIGDWIVNRLGNIWHIDSFDAKNYQVTTTKGEHNYFPINIQDRMHLWTIDDAKDGDVLIDKSGSRECPFVFKATKPSNIKTDIPNPLVVLGYCGIGGAGFTKGSGWGDTANCIYYPATKEQRDLLFQKMKEAGYEWDAEKKELKKIEQKPAEWKQENVEELSEFENAMMHIGYSFFGKRGGLDPNDTSSVKIQAQYLLELAQKPAEWSEEDDDDAWMNDIISKVENNLQLNKAEIDWLKSLKPQKHLEAE